MNTVERRLSKKNLNEMAKARLIEERKCSKHRDDTYNVICYGLDINTLDSSRKWIYDEEMALHGDTERARIAANKLVLYVNDSELASKIRELRKEGL